MCVFSVYVDILGYVSIKVLWARMCLSQHIMNHCVPTCMAKAADEGLFFTEHILSSCVNTSI